MILEQGALFSWHLLRKKEGRKSLSIKERKDAVAIAIRPNVGPLNLIGALINFHVDLSRKI
jgi:hypothetical protein